MRLITEGAELNISITRYEFPQLPRFPDDEEWLMVHLTLRLPTRKWETFDPSLTVAEAKCLRDWLRKGARSAPLFADWQDLKNPLSTKEIFTEPNLSFELLSSGDAQRPFVFRIYMAAESLPPFAAQLCHSLSDDKPNQAWLDFKASSDDLARMAAELSVDLTQLPSRSNGSRRFLLQGVPR